LFVYPSNAKGARSVDKQKQAKRRRRRFRPVHVFLCCLLVVGAMGAVMVTQEAKLHEIAEEQNTLQAQLDRQLLEEQRLNRMQEYVETDEYLAQYAREKFGYVLPEDFKFYREEANAG